MLAEFARMAGRRVNKAPRRRSLEESIEEEERSTAAIGAAPQKPQRAMVLLMSLIMFLNTRQAHRR